MDSHAEMCLHKKLGSDVTDWEGNIGGNTARAAYLGSLTLVCNFPSSLHALFEWSFQGEKSDLSRCYSLLWGRVARFSDLPWRRRVLVSMKSFRGEGKKQELEQKSKTELLRPFLSLSDTQPGVVMPKGLRQKAEVQGQSGYTVSLWPVWLHWEILFFKKKACQNAMVSYFV